MSFINDYLALPEVKFFIKYWYMYLLFISAVAIKLFITGRKKK